MNGSSAIRFREYEAAIDRLKAIFNQLDTEEGRDAALKNITIGIARFDGDTPGVRYVAKAVAEAFRADVPNYLASLIERAQADVHAAADALRNAIDLDLETKFMKKAKGK